MDSEQESPLDAGMAQAPAGPFGILQGHLDQANARLNAADKVSKQLTNITGELTNLAKMGDTVTPDDVVNSAGRLVAQGSDAMEMAGLLADMPENPQQLQAWIAQHAQAAQAQVAKLAPVHDLARHHVGMAALRMITAHSINDHMQSMMPQAPEGMN